MESKELLFNLIKKLESKEPSKRISVDYHIRMKNEVDDLVGGFIKIFLIDHETQQKITLLDIEEIKDGTKYQFDENWNKEFKENFYKEKGLDNCWVKDCPNKIYQKEGDYKKLRVQCQDKHTRMVCLEHSKEYEK